MSSGHYENFPVASILCPPALRPPILAIYRFARTADDIADEGDAAPQARLAELAAYRADLAAIAAGRGAGGRWPQVFGPLAMQMRRFELPAALLDDLLDAFVQDAANPLHADRASLLDYCRRSANPVGRLLLHLYRVDDETSLRRSDAICTALQLINFWQDVGRDAQHGRFYLPLDELRQAGVTLDALRARQDSAALRQLIERLCRWAAQLMHEGTPLAERLGGRAGWELRFVVQGGLRILEKIRAMDFATIAARPTLVVADGPRLLWRAIAMSSPP